MLFYSLTTFGHVFNFKMSATFKHHVGKTSIEIMDLTHQVRTKIVGLSWKKLRGDVPLQSLENLDDTPPAKNLRPRGINGTPPSAQRENDADGAQEKKFLRRARSVRLMKDAFGTLKQVKTGSITYQYKLPVIRILIHLLINLNS